MEQVLNWLAQNQALAVMLAVIGLIIFIFSLKSTTTKIFASSRGVSAGRDINGTVTTGDFKSHNSGFLSILANIATILGLLIGSATLYVSYLALDKMG
jgi:hypothetical protein